MVNHKKFIREITKENLFWTADIYCWVYVVLRSKCFSFDFSTTSSSLFNKKRRKLLLVVNKFHESQAHCPLPDDNEQHIPGCYYGIQEWSLSPYSGP